MQDRGQDRGLELDADEADAIAELFNIGMGESAAALSGMVGEEVLLSVPALRVQHRTDIINAIPPGEARRMCAVREAFSGPFSGEAMLLFPEPEGMALVRRLIPGDANTPGDDEQDALTEIGNIILNGCLASFSNLIASEVAGSVPGYRAGTAEQVIGHAEDPVLSVSINVGLAAGDVSGQVMFLLDIASREAFGRAVQRLIAGAGGTAG